MNGYGKLVMEWTARVGIPAAIAFVLLFQLGSKMDRMISLQEKTVTILERSR